MIEIANDVINKNNLSIARLSYRQSRATIEKTRLKNTGKKRSLEIKAKLQEIRIKNIEKSNQTIRSGTGQKRRMSNFKGVYQHRNAWQVKIKIDNKSINLGRFSTQEEAAHNYDYHVLHTYGLECHLNFPDFNYEKFKPKKIIGEIKVKQLVMKREGWGRKLNKKIAHAIRKKYINDKIFIKDLAKLHNVTIATIYNIINQVTYRNKNFAKVSVIYNPKQN